MNSRRIVTSQPDVACDVCERRLLRGEQPETFLAAGQTRTVCELCAPRAAHQGWKRASDLDSASAGVERPRRARGIFDRLRAAGRTQDTDSEDAADGAGTVVFEAEGLERPHEAGNGAVGAILQDEPAEAAGPLARALEVFNESEHPRRIGGVARSLGAPDVSVRELDVAGIVSIVVAWELCWYRYRVDADDPGAGARLVAQGSELSELEREEREANAAADESGTLHLDVRV